MGMKYELSSPMVFGSPDSDEYRDGWERIFGRKEKAESAPRCGACGAPESDAWDCPYGGPHVYASRRGEQ